MNPSVTDLTAHSCAEGKHPRLLVIREDRIDPSSPKMRAGLFALVDGLRDHGFEVTITFTQGLDPWAIRPLPKEFSVMILPTIGSKLEFLTKFPSMVRQLTRAMRDHDIVWAISPLFPSVPALIAARIARKPSVLFLQASVSAWGNLFYQRRIIGKIVSFLLTNLQVMLSTETLVLGDHLVRDVLPVMRKKKVTLTPFGTLTDADFKTIGDPVVDRKVNLLYVGRLVPLKRVDVAVEAVAHLRRMGVDATLTIVGDGVLRASLEKLAEKLELTEYVEFAGWIADPVALRKKYRDSFALILPSEYEALGLVAVESSAAGTPVIRTAAPEMAVFFEPERDVIVIPIQSPKLFADAVIKLSEDPDRYTAIARSAQKKVARFTAAAWYRSFCESAQRALRY